MGEKVILIENDDFLIEEYKNDTDYYRRLILKEDLNTIQTQYKLKDFGKKNKKFT